MLFRIMSHETNEISSTQRLKRVTLQDIADVAGVKKMVISNVLNGTGRVAPATREKVKRIAREMNYIPNLAARALTTGRTDIIAILTGALSEPYYADMVHLLERHISTDGFHVMLMRTPDEVKELVNATGNVAVDGAIAVDVLNLVSQFRSHSTVPCVSISTSRQSFVDSVLVDLSAGVEEALGLMLAAGRRRVAYMVTADSMALESETRARTYLATMKKAGRVAEIINVSTDEHFAIELKFKAHLEKHGVPDALLCQNDQTAMCAFQVLRELGLQVPSDVLLAGCDGLRSMRYLEPPLSTIAQPIEEMCATAWQFLQQRIARSDLPHQTATFQGQLIVTRSLLASSSL